MTRYNGGTKVSGGYYFNLSTWRLEAVSGTTGTLSTEGAHVRLPGVAVLPAVLLLSFAFVVFLPFIGVALVAWALSKKLAALLGSAVSGSANLLAPAWRPGVAWFARPPQKKAEPVPASAELTELEREVAARRNAEK